MSKAVKKLVCSEIETRFKGVDAAILVSLHALDAGDMHGLRSALRENGARLTVVKNSLAKRAFKTLGYPDDLDALFEGTVAIAYGSDEPTVLAKTVAEFGKTRKDNILIRGGVLENKVLTKEDIQSLAKLPGRQQMIGILAGTLNAPIVNFAGAVAGTIRNLVNVLNAVKDKREEGGGDEAK